MASRPKEREANARITREIGDQAILDMVAEGKSQRAIAAYVSEATNKPTSVYFINRYLHRDQEASERYRAAKLIAAQNAVDKLGEITEELLQGKRDAPSVKVASDNLKWTASKLDPASFSDRIQVDAQVLSITDMHLSAMRDAMRATVVTQAIERQDKSVETAA